MRIATAGLRAAVMALVATAAVFTSLPPSITNDASPVSAAAGCPDVDGDGTVHLIDLILVSEYFGDTVPPAPSQVNVHSPKDGAISIADQLDVASALSDVTGCQTSGLSKTPAAGGAFTVDADGESTASGDTIQATRSVPVGDTFHINVHLTPTPAGLTGYKVELHWDEAYLDLTARDAEINDVWANNDADPNLFEGSVQELGPADDGSGSEAYIWLATWDAVPPGSFGYIGPVAQFEFTCQAAGTANITLGGSGFTSLANRPDTDYNNPTRTGAQVTCQGPPPIPHYVGHDLATKPADVTLIGDRNAPSPSDLGVATGDVNGDTVADLVVSSPGSNSGDGEVWVIYGDASFGAGAPSTIDLDTTPPDVVITAPDAGAVMGLSSTALGDFDGDTVKDIAIGASYDGTGRVYVIYGENDWPATINLTSLPGDVEVTRIDAIDAGDSMDAVSVAEISGDPVDDLAIGADGGDGSGNGEALAGEAYVFFGASDRRTQTSLSASAANYVAYGPDAGDLAGYTAIIGPDLSGDGNSELFIGVPGGDGGWGTVPVRSNAGEAHVIFGELSSGTRDLGIQANLILVGSVAGNQLVAANSGTGNNIVAGSSPLAASPTSEAQAGEVYLQRQGPYLDGTVLDTASTSNALRVVGADAGDLLGRGSSGPFLNEDAHQEAIIGAPGADGPGAGTGERANAGEAWLFYGTAGLPIGVLDVGGTLAPPYQRLFGAAAGDQFGVSLTSGDLNGDGLPEVIFTAPGADVPGRTDAGKIYVFMSNTPKVRLDAEPGGGVDVARNVQRGDTISVDVRIEDVPTIVGLGSFDVQVSYNNAALEGVSIAQGPYFNSLGISYSCSQNSIGSGTARLACAFPAAQPVPGPTGDGTLFTMNFNARPAASGSSSLSITSATLTEPARSASYTYDLYGATISVEYSEQVGGGGAGCDDSDVDGCPAADLDLSEARGGARGSVYLGDTGSHVIRRIQPELDPPTSFRVAGDEGVAGYQDGFGTDALFDEPSGIAIDERGTLYVADACNHRIRAISPAGLVKTVAGSGATGCGNGSYGGDNGPATSATLDTPRDIAVDRAGNLYIADTNNCIIRKVDARTGIITTIAGIALSCGYSVDGSALATQLDHPEGIAVEPFIDATRPLTIVISDTGNDRIRRIRSGQISTIAGGGGGCTEPCPATNAILQDPRGLAVDAKGRIFFANSDASNGNPNDTANRRVRKIGLDGQISTIAGGAASPGAGCDDSAAGGCPALNVALETTSDVILGDEMFAVTDEYVRRIFDAGDVRPNTRPAAGQCSGTRSAAGDTALLVAPLTALVLVGGWRRRRRPDEPAS